MKRIQNKKLLLKKTIISIHHLYGGSDGNDGNEETITSSSAYQEPTEGPSPTPIDDTNPRLDSREPYVCN